MSGNTILVVEDESDIREMLSFSLERAGYSVVEAASAEEGLRRPGGRPAEPGETFSRPFL